MRKVIAYIDGFNLYHAIDDLRKPHLKWLDLKALAASICGDKETLAATKYFSAHATWLPPAFIRHKAYVAALKHVGVECYIGHFKEKHRHCGASQGSLSPSHGIQPSTVGPHFPGRVRDRGRLVHKSQLSHQN